MNLRASGRAENFLSERVSFSIMTAAWSFYLTTKTIHGTNIKSVEI
jgi:hypothetical protein